jgi:hypothetical protein
MINVKNFFIMSTTILNFKKVELVAESQEAARAKMEETLFHYNGDATQAFHNWKKRGTKGITDRDIKEFMLDYLSKKSKNAPGCGYLITLDSAVKDTRNRPYKINNVKNEEGARKFKTIYIAIDKETGATIGKWDTNKADALNAIKEMYKNGLYKGNFDLNKIKEVVSGQAKVAEGWYTPSKNTKNGTYLAFGIEA